VEGRGGEEIYVRWRLVGWLDALVGWGV
jgi:hypothetical protein